MISTTMGLLDQRMSMIEDNVAVLNAKSRGLNTIPVTKHDSSERGKNKGTYTGTEGAIVNPNVSSSSDSVNGVSNTVFQWMKEEEDSGDVNNSNTQGLSESILNDFMNASLEDSVNAGTVSGTNTGVDVDDSNVSNCGSSSNTDTFEDNYVVEDEDENALNPDLDE